MQPFIPAFVPLEAASIPLAPVDGLTATQVQGAIEELAARESGGGGGEISLPNASTVPGKPASLSFAVPDGIAPYTQLNIELGFNYQPIGANGFETYVQFFERIGGMGLTDDTGLHALAVGVDGLTVTLAIDAPLRVTGPGADELGIPVATFFPRSPVDADSDTAHLRHGDELLSETLTRLETGGDEVALPNASTIPAGPASVTITIAPGPGPEVWETLEFVLGDFYCPLVSPLAGETWQDFFARAGALGLADETGQNVLSIEIAGDAITLTCGARIRSNSTIFFFKLGHGLDVSPTPAQNFDTGTATVRHGDEKLSVVVDRLVARPVTAHPRSVIRGNRDLSSFPNLVANGAVAGDYLAINYSDGVTNFQDSMPITETTTFSDFAIWASNSTALNPGGPMTEIEVDYDQGGTKGLLLWSKSGYQVNFYSTFGDGAGARSLVGSLPA